ncbi:sulfatase-like hydrolase/transferase [Pontiella agarivorans]|uniref:Sulfatase-like hydrolase/transferase n=1 Tax=Pontiella agarivorans TaxID=3038953 RepID=A0ABU5MW33_9BACT|nr:sulfatase-like hydrolase/transferase [Pontiella agarivorans]MDZ8118409.1 sulfatase-like hydrolase/transferase [Pontiella agarivorans]
MKHTIISMLILSAACAEASVIVQWGESGGHNAVVSSSANFVDGSITTNYSGSQPDVYIDSGYYELNTASRSPMFQVSASLSSFDSAQTQNNSGFDRIRLVADVTHMETMFVWDDFLTTDDLVTGFSWYGYAAGESSADLYFLIHKDGAWYAALGSDRVNGAGGVDLPDATAATWYAFTPITNGAAAIGPEVSVDLSGVTAVGCYIVLPSGSGTNIGPYMGYFQVTAVSSIGGPPAFIADSVIKSNAMEGVAYTNSIAGDASDPDGDPMTFYKTGGPAWLNVETNGQITGTPGVFDTGTNTFTVEVSAVGGTDSAILEIVVDGAPAVGSPPAFSNDPIIKPNATRGLGYTNSIALEASDPEGDPMTFSKGSGPAWLSVDPDGTIYGTPAESDEGLNEFTVQVIAAGGADSATLNITVERPPVPWNPHSVMVDFTIDQGYVDGDVNNSSNWVAMGANTVNTHASGYDGGEGVLVFDPDTTYRDAVFNSYALLAEGERITSESVFRFNSTNTGSSATSYILYAHLYSDEWSVDANEVQVRLRRVKTAPDIFSIQTLSRDDSNASQFEYSAEFSGSVLGLSSGIGQSDWLKMTSVLTKGADASSWSLSLRLENLATAFTVVDETLTGIVTASDFYNAGPVYPGLTSGNTDEQLQVATGSREVDTFNSFTDSVPLVGHPPAFTLDPIQKPVATVDTGYTNSIALDAVDPEGDPLTFSKLSGPAWLTVETNGVIWGTPQSPDLGTNRFTVQVSAVGGTDTAALEIEVESVPVVKTGWQEFYENYALSGNKDADFDMDGASDVAEFAFGGNPVNAESRPMEAYLEFDGINAVTFYSVETAHTNPGISYVWEWTDSLTSNVWNTEWASTNFAASTLAGYNEVNRQLDITGMDNLYFRNRLFRRPQPNILMILMDDLGYCDVGFMADIFGEARPLSPSTPNIDSLAGNGIICSQAYVPHPFCGPSRMGLLTGRYPHHFGGSKNHPYETADRPSQAFLDAYPQYEKANEVGMHTNETTIAKVLQWAGYHTGAIGKWHCGVAEEYHPNNRGFDYWYGMLGGGHNYYSDGWMSKTNPAVVNDYQFWLTRNGEEVDPAVDPGPGRHYITDIFSDDAVAFIKNRPADRPFFLYLCYNAPHAPMQGKAEDLIELFGGDGDEDNYTREQNGIAMMHAVDRGVSNIIETLTLQGELDNTLIVFLSDNGGKERDAADNENEADNGPLKGGKGDTYEGGVRSPMFIHYPAEITEPGMYEHPIYPYDLYPTLARLADASVPGGKVLSGKDVWTQILASRDAHNDDAVIWLRHNSGANHVSIRKGRYKANRLNNGGWKLYDIVTDYSESNDIVSGNETILDDMIADGLIWTNDTVDPLWHDTEAGYWNWETNNMPNYDATFSR